MRKLAKFFMCFIFLFFLSIFIWLLTIKILVYRNAIEDSIEWNDSKTCYIATYVPYYEPYGFSGRLLYFFSNQSFFVVYDQQGNKLRSSAWYFWKSQFSDSVAAEWTGRNVVYPTSDGWDGWRVPECSGDSKS